MSGIMMSNVNYEDVPIRSKASPRSSPSASVYSRRSDESLSESYPEPRSFSGGQSRLTRGRTMIQHSAYSRSTTVQQAGLALFDFGNNPWRERLTSRDLTSEPEEFLDRLLEPCPKEIIRTMAEMLYHADTFGSDVDVSGFGGHRDTFAILGLRRIPRSTDLPIRFFRRLVLYVDFETYLSVRLCCRGWSEAISHARTLKLPAVSSLPAEILERIYDYLSPADFNSARHTCRLWMSVSLEWRLLTKMLKRGYWWAAAEADMAVDEALGTGKLTLSNEWLLSKRLSTECSLRPDWTGDGLKQSLAASFIKLYDNRSIPTTGTPYPPRLILACEVDFSELGHVYSVLGFHQYSITLGFTVSIYNKLLLVHADCSIYVYSFEDMALDTFAHRGSYLEFLTSITCPYPVLAVGMDTSRERFTVTALLEGRMCLVYDLYDNVVVKKRCPPIPYSPMHSKLDTWENKAEGRARPGVHRVDTKGDLSRTKSSVVDRATQETSSSTSRFQQHGSVSTPPISPPLGIRQRFISNICSKSSPPLSVAICPQRRCVAFGSSTGIELHWVDAMRGNFFDRWFPITANSDILHFMPQRPGVDSARKLRLLTSAKNPDSKEAVVNRRLLSQTRLEGEKGEDSANFDQAVPLSDGTHVLFTCPVSGELSLGHEGPPVIPGQTNLLTRAVLLGPRNEQGRGMVPKVYKAAAELRWGVRVAVGFADSLWLFSVPPDMFFSGRACEHCEDEDEDKENLWPLQIQGIEIGTVRGLSEVAVDAECGGITVWAFGAEGKAYMYHLRDGRNRETNRRVVLGTGEIVDEKDVDGDVHMHGTEDHHVSFKAEESFGFPSPDSYEDISTSFFTTAGPLPLLPVENDGNTVLPDALPAAMLEDEGYVSDADRSDTPMPDAPAYHYQDKDENDDEGYVSAEEHEEMQQAGGIWMSRTPTKWSREGEYLGENGERGGRRSEREEFDDGGNGRRDEGWLDVEILGGF